MYVCPSVVALCKLSPYDRSYGRRPGAGFDLDNDEVHYPTRPVDKDKAEQELAVNIKKATSTDESAPKQKHVRSTCATPMLCDLKLLTPCRMYCVHMGLPLVHLLLVRTSRPANSLR